MAPAPCCWVVLLVQLPQVDQLHLARPGWAAAWLVRGRPPCLSRTSRLTLISRGRDDSQAASPPAASKRLPPPPPLTGPMSLTPAAKYRTASHQTPNGQNSQPYTASQPASQPAGRRHLGGGRCVLLWWWAGAPGRGTCKMPPRQAFSILPPLLLSGRVAARGSGLQAATVSASVRLFLSSSWKCKWKVEACKA